MVIIVFGLPGSGKSFFSKALAKQLGAEYLSSDLLRDSLGRPNSYSRADKNVVYDVMLTKMLSAIHECKTVVLDATFYKHDLRKRFTTYVPDSKQLSFIEIVASEPVIRQRLFARANKDEADYSVYEVIKNEWEKPEFPHLVLESTNDNLHSMLEKAKDYLHVSPDPAAHLNRPQ